MAKYGEYKKFIPWLKDRQKRKPFQPGETVTTLRADFKKDTGIDIPPKTAMAYFQDTFGSGALPSKFPEAELLTKEYIEKKLKEGKTKDIIKNEWAKENNVVEKISKGRTLGTKNKFDSIAQNKIYTVINQNPDLKKLEKNIKKNRNSTLNLKRYKKYIKDNVNKYLKADGSYKPGFREDLYTDAVEYFKKTYPGSVQTYSDLKGGQRRIAGGTEFVKIKSGAGASAGSYENARSIIREAAENELPTTVGKKSKRTDFDRLKIRDTKAAKSLGMSEPAYKSLINKTLLYPLGKLFPSLFRTPYAPSAEHIYPLQQAIATNMVGELKAGAKAIVPSTKKLNLLIKGPILDSKATSQLRLAYEASDPKIKQKYLDTANKLISNFKKEYPGSYPKYELTARNNIVNVNPPGPGMLKAPLTKKVTEYIDSLIKTPGFLESDEFKNLPSEASQLILSRSKTSYESNLDKFVQKVKSVPGGCRAVVTAALGGPIDACEAIIKADPKAAAVKLNNAITATKGPLKELKEDSKKLANFIDTGQITTADKLPRPDDAVLKDTFKETNLRWNNDVGAFETTNGDIASQSDIKKYAADNPMEVKVGEEPVKAATNKSVLGNVGKALARVGAPLPTALIDSYFIGQQVKEGKGTAEIASNPLNWLGLATMEPLSKVAGIAEGGAFNKALRLGLNPATIRGITRFAGLPGLAVSTAMTAYDQYQKYKDGEGFIFNLLNQKGTE